MSNGIHQDDPVFDIFVAGGGINGCGVARDAAGRGLSVCLAEMNDLASATSSGSTKLIHGGLRYLEHYEFNLVRKALTEREVLWNNAPHIIRPLRFILPHHQGLRPAWLLRLGLFLYDHLGARKRLPGTRTVKFAASEFGVPLMEGFKKGFEYSDCWVDDARLVVLNARDAAIRGAQILTRTRVLSARRDKGLWIVTTLNKLGEKRTIRARVLVNATGPWVDQFRTDSLNQPADRNIRMVRGSHIVAHKIFSHDRCYLFQNSDGRIVFAIPYEEEFTLIGTTDCDFSGDPGEVQTTEEEVAYLCDSINHYFRESLDPSEVVWHFSAVRPLYDDSSNHAQTATRDYRLEIDAKRGKAALINILGGKITTYRVLAEAVLAEARKKLKVCGPSWTAATPLPGGDFLADEFDQQVSALVQDYPFLAKRHANRLFRLYGSTARDLLGNARNLDELGTCFGSDLFEAEVSHLVENEWASQAEDVLWRRTKEGLRFSPSEAEELDRYLVNINAQMNKIA